MVRMWSWMAVLVLGALSCASVANAQQAAPLPLRRVRLYETGIGYFERTGPLAAGTAVELPVPNGHLDDALKLLVVLSNDGALVVDGIEFSSSVSRDMARALAGLPANSEQGLSQVQLLGTLKGAAVTMVVGKVSHRGRLIDVVVPSDDDQQECVLVREEGERKGTETCRHRRGEVAVLLLTEAGAIRRFVSREIHSVTPTDPAWRARLTSALDALSNTRAKNARKLRVHGRGGKAVTLGYIAETPVWRSSYRLVLPNNEAPAHLQGWALLHNDTDEDWKHVQVELVNGRPDSFLFPLAAPRYARRELVTPGRELSTLPQLMGRTVDNMWSGEGGGLAMMGTGAGGSGYGYGVGGASMGRMGHGGGGGRAGVTSSSLLAAGNLAQLAAAEGVESGALFQYKLGKPVDLRAHGSALLPFLNVPLQSVQATYFEHAGEEGRSAVHVTNHSRQTMPAGPIAVFAAGGFAGETTLPRTKPGQARILQFGFDQDSEIHRRATHTSEAVVHLRSYAGGLEEHYLRVRKISYELVNRSGTPRHLYLALDVSNKGNVRGADGLIFDEQSHRAVAVFVIKGMTRKKQQLVVSEGLVRKHPFKQLGPRKLHQLASAPKLLAHQRDILRRAVADMKQAEKHFVAASKLRRRLVDAKEEVVRWRASVYAAGRSIARGAPLVQRLASSESRVTELQNEIRDHDAKGTAAREAAVARLRTLDRPQPAAATPPRK